MKKLLPLAFTLFVLHSELHAQYQIDRYDTSYYISYRDKITLGALFVKKSTAFKMNAPDAGHAFRYLSNSPGRFGFSAGHDFLTLSGTFGVGKLDPSYTDDKGKTKQLNLQLSVTGRKILADIYFQKYKGLFVGTDNSALYTRGNYYVRPDIETELYGTTVTLIDKSRRFTAQAPFLLDARQKKSAGSLLYGGEFFYGKAKGDSAFIPSALAAEYPHANVRELSFITFGPGLGYGYTFVAKEHLFATAMASLNADVSYIKEWDTDNQLGTTWKFNPNFKAKGAIGYNADRWGIALSYVSNRLFFKASETDARYLNYNDNYKLMYVRRINAGKTVPKITGFAKKIINKVGLGFLVN
ncbi:DUF4421 family protein [Niabella insulamsoli]|uniref:DUF4421 family protein n=1 Tax=Niabella insulamsoli TaxID=3144874 RepID=UPI0031FC73A1